ncbi:MAG TPA: acyltransferase [Pirellulales bacterium]|jgi:peptidoglycan/LPS O-acetylase OafA/YrhL|nr:acyltransferase [Pirellulales bacterium]
MQVISAQLNRPVESERPVWAQAPSLPKHVPALDGIRGFAILLVTAYRFSLGPVDADYGRIGRVLFKAFSVGNLGVDLFFVLSGFLITGILFDAKGSSHYFRNFYLRRALRIYPLYYGVLLVALVALPLLLGARYQLFPEARADQASLWLYVANFLMGFRNEWCLGSFRHFWSLCVEEHFYLLWPLVIFFCSRRQAMAACLLTISFAIVGRIVWLMLGGPKVAIEAFTCFQCDGLALGSFLALVARGPRGIRAYLPWALVGMILTGLSMGYISTLADRQLLGFPITICSAFFGGLLVLAVSARSTTWLGKIWGSRPLAFFGKYSYAMYVFQLPLIEILAPVLNPEMLIERSGSAFIGRMAYILAMFAITTAGAVLSWNLFEKHFLALKSRFHSESSQPVLAASPSVLPETS